jgi:hypothetical protein
VKPCPKRQAIRFGLWIPWGIKGKTAIYTLSSRCSPRFIPERHGWRTAELLACQKSQCSRRPRVRVRSKIERGDQRECTRVLTKDGDELEWPDLEVAAISILAGTRTTAPRALAGPAVLRHRERRRCSACHRGARGGSSLLWKGSWPTNRATTCTLLWLGR